jgi:hypothetical protein
MYYYPYITLRKDLPKKFKNFHFNIEKTIYDNYEFNYENIISNYFNTKNFYIKKSIWEDLSSNPFAIDLLLKNKDLIDWHNFSANPHSKAVQLLEQNLDKVYWNKLSGNNCPGAISLLKKNWNKIQWQDLSSNPSAIKLLEAYPEKIDWNNFSKNPNLLFYKGYIDLTKINLILLCQNPNLYKILEKFIGLGKLLLQSYDKYYIERNSSLFTYDYAFIKVERKELNEAIIQKIYEPSRIAKWLEAGNEIDEYMC